MSRVCRYNIAQNDSAALKPHHAPINHPSWLYSLTIADPFTVPSFVFYRMSWSWQHTYNLESIQNYSFISVLIMFSHAFLFSFNSRPRRESQWRNYQMRLTCGHVCGILSWLFILVERPSPVWAATFPRAGDPELFKRSYQITGLWENQQAASLRIFCFKFLLGFLLRLPSVMDCNL